MPSIRVILITAVIGSAGAVAGWQVFAAGNDVTPPEGLVTDFVAAEHYSFTDVEQARIGALIEDTHQIVQGQFPGLTDDVRFTVMPIERDIEGVGGSTGRADSPNDIVIELSTVYPGGIDAVLRDSLSSTVMHELHHLVRGWTIRGNQFGRGIDIAAVNEGLAVVFAEDLSGQVFPSNAAPEEAEDWAMEIRDLPPHANYGEWMFAHPDGREAVGYRTGSYIVRRAMARSGLSLNELTRHTPDEIWELAELAE